MISVLAPRPRLARTAATIVSDLVDDLRTQRRISPNTRDRATTFARALLPVVSPRLRHDIEKILCDDPSSLLPGRAD